MGGASGLLAGLGVLAIPDLGPVLAGGWLVAAALGAVEEAGVGDDQAEIALEVLRKANGIDIEDLRRVYEQEGWSHFDENAPELTADEMRDYRDRYPLVPPLI
ncbi:MAG: hypothetical protein ACYC0C_09695 [Devosia sp.]